ncbi:MAG: phosphatase PAP2 family protein [Acidobacteriota bacterium]|nr:MAG: phosphatase PAP2 family protein [Acidobacteriota bacterium]
MHEELSRLPAWLPLIYLLIHSALVLVSPRRAVFKLRIVLINTGVSAFFIWLALSDSPLSSEGLFRGLLLWMPIVFFWAAYVWARHTLTAIHPEGFNLDRPIIDLENRLFRQPSLHWSRRGNPLLTELLHIAYASYYLYTPALGIYLDVVHRDREFQAMSFAVLFGYLIAYSFFALTPVFGPRWSLVELGLLDASEQYQKGYGVTRFTNWLMFRGPAHKGGAMPSSHSSTAMVFMIWSWRAWPPEIAICCTLLGVGMWFGSIYGRYHFVIDVLIGALIGLGSVFVADALILS